MRRKIGSFKRAPGVNGPRHAADSASPALMDRDGTAERGGSGAAHADGGSSGGSSAPGPWAQHNVPQKFYSPGHSCVLQGKVSEVEADPDHTPTPLLPLKFCALWS